MFADIVGNEQIKQAYDGMADSGRVPHAILMEENEGCGALVLAQAFLQYLNCHHRSGGDACGNCTSCHQHGKWIYPDVRYTFPITSGSKVSGEVKNLTCDDYAKYWRELCLSNPYFLESELSEALGIEKKTGVIAVAEGKAILSKLSLSAVSDGYRAVVVWLPEKMNAQTANMLLKAIEEPAEKTLFLLITHSPENVLQTISSRCLHIRVLPLSREEVAEVLERRFDVAPDRAAQAAAFSGGSVGVALRLLGENGGDSQQASLFKSLMDSILERDYLAVLQLGETLSGLDSREKQKAFCTFAGGCLRKVFMLQQGMDTIAGVASEEMPDYASWAERLDKAFCRRCLSYLGRAQMLIDRNVNQKIVFCNLVTRMFASVRPGAA